DYEAFLDLALRLCDSRLLTWLHWRRRCRTSVVRSDGNNRSSILFPNGSRIVGLPQSEAKVRGFSKVSLLLIEEAARVHDVLYRAMRPTLAVGNGDIWGTGSGDL